jgi:hypothetical protein
LKADVEGKDPRGVRLLFLLVLVVSVGLRLALTLVNRDANDSHEEVVDRILASGRLPVGGECWECAQPKLYHATVAGLIKAIGPLGHEAHILIAQGLNCAAGILTIVLIWQLLLRLSAVGARARLLSFSLVALNPKLIGISSQATNDAFAILFSTLALCGVHHYLQRRRLGHLVLAALAVSLAIASKTNSWPIFAASLVALLAHAAFGAGRRGVLVALGWLLLVPALVLLNPLSQYLRNVRERGTPVLNNISTQPLPHFFQQTETSARAGVLSIRDGFLTFKFSSLLRHPSIENERTPYSSHRTSLWTQLYGRMYSVTFDNWPPSWGSTGSGNFPLLRAIFVLALLPAAVLMLGGVAQAFWFSGSLLRRDRAAAAAQHFGLFPLALFGSLAFVALYALLYRDFAVMKAIFVFPALPAIAVVYAEAAERLPRQAVRAFAAVVACLACLSAAEIGVLIARLVSPG